MWLLLSLGAKAAGDAKTYPGGSSVWSSIVLLVIMAAVIVGAYVVTRMIANGAMRGQKGSHMRLVDRIQLARDRFVAVVEIGGEYFMIGVAGNSITLLSKLNDPPYDAPETATGTMGSRFAGILRTATPPAAKPKTRAVREDELEALARQIRERDASMRGKIEGKEPGNES